MYSFQREKLPPASNFYKQELELGKPSRGWARTACPFHRGTNTTAFAVNLTTGGFFCHNCGVKGGDLVDYVRLRDGVDFITAAKSLGAWFETDSTTAQQIARDREARLRAREEAEEREGEERRLRPEARDWLHSLERVYDFASARLGSLLHNESADAELCWQIMAHVLPQIRQAEETYYRLAGLSHD